MIHFKLLCSRNNFIELDIFMRELSYQEITQHHAYEITNLLGKLNEDLVE